MGERAKQEAEFELAYREEQRWQKAQEQEEAIRIMERLSKAYGLILQAALVDDPAVQARLPGLIEAVNAYMAEVLKADLGGR